MKKANNICCLFFLKKLKIGTQYNEYGIQITIIASIPGINYKKGRNYKFQTGFMIYPNGKIENTTIFGGKIK